MPRQTDDAHDETARRFLAARLCGRDDAADAAGGSALDWDAVRRIARAEGIAPLVYPRVRGRGLVPPNVERSFHDAYYATARRNAALLQDLEAILQRLAAAGLEAIVLKGAGLAETIYGNIAVRPMFDLDVLVRPQAAPAALEALAALGYAPAHVEPRTGYALAYGSEIALLRRGPRETWCEVHWNLIDAAHYQRKLDVNWFWETAQPARIGQTPAQVLGPEGQVLYLCAHLCLHHSGRGLLWRNDIARVIALHRADINWEQVLARAREYDLALPLQRTLPGLADEWGAPIPPDVVQRLEMLQPSREEKQAFAWAANERLLNARQFWGNVQGLPGWARRWGYVWSNVFPAPAYMQARYHIRRRALLPLYYGYRLALGLKGIAGLLAAWPRRRRAHESR